MHLNIFECKSLYSKMQLRFACQFEAIFKCMSDNLIFSDAFSIHLAALSRPMVK